jgi:hypothetical protein
MSDLFHAPADLPRGESRQYPLGRRLGGSQNRSGSRGEEKILAPIGLKSRPLLCPARVQALYGPSYPGLSVM